MGVYFPLVYSVLSVEFPPIRLWKHPGRLSGRVENAGLVDGIVVQGETPIMLEGAASQRQTGPLD